MSDVKQEKQPSCSICYLNNNLIYHNFSTGESYKVIEYIMVRYNLTFNQCLDKITYDFNLKKYENSSYAINSINNFEYNNTFKSIIQFSQITPKPTTVIRIKKRDYTQRDLQYWEGYYWNKRMLEESKTYSISHYEINDKFYKIDKRELAFSYDYYFHKEIMRRKLYFPNKELYKWFSNVDPTIIQLVDVGPKCGDILIITSSKKDSGLFWRLNIDKVFPDVIIHSVAPNNESSFVPEQWLEKAKQRWKRIVIWYDNDFHKEDNPGIYHAKRFAEKYNLEFTYTPDFTEKDPSDFYKTFGFNNFKNLVQTNLKI